ncbi:MAG: glycine cleavage system aminomethyltransferase GcvT [bacterium]|nr:glycine cleavage system aminomethyltransferase GcvT [bacterium]
MVEGRKTPFYDRHVALGGRMVEFAGYAMPVRYTSIIEEHRTTRETVGMFDLSHMGEFCARGPQVADALDYAATNNVPKLEIGQVLYTPLCIDSGGIVDDLLIYRVGAEEFMLVPNAANIVKDRVHLEGLMPSDAEFEDRSDYTGMIAVQGPRSREVVERAAGISLADMKFYRFASDAEIAGQNVLISRTGYTGELGYEIYVEDDKNQLAVWDAIYPPVEKAGGCVVGLGARDTLRMEMAYCLYGNDINETTTPLEAGIGWTVKLKRDEYFLGKGTLVKQKEDGLTRKLVGLTMVDSGIPRQGYDIYVGEEIVGNVTSGTQSPSLDISIGLGYVNKPYDKTGTDIWLDIRGKRKKAIVAETPFIKNKHNI